MAILGYLIYFKTLHRVVVELNVLNRLRPAISLWLALPKLPNQITAHLSGSIAILRLLVKHLIGSYLEVALFEHSRAQYTVVFHIISWLSKSKIVWG